VSSGSGKNDHGKGQPSEERATYKKQGGNRFRDRGCFFGIVLPFLLVCGGMKIEQKKKPDAFRNVSGFLFIINVFGSANEITLAYCKDIEFSLVLQVYLNNLIKYA